MQKALVLIVFLFSITGFCQNKFEVFFDFNKDIPNESSKDKIKLWMMENRNIEITKIYGYCDTVDDHMYNKDLAMRRTQNMLNYFKNEKFPVAANVETKSFGKDFKYSLNQNENRKVIIFYDVIEQKKSESVQENDFEFLPTTVVIEEERSSLEAKFRKAREGDLIRINNINFYFNSEKIKEESLPILEELFMIMHNNPELRIQINGHICCNPNPNDTKLSYRRALVILQFLVKRGIKVNRLGYKGYGSNDPIYKLPEKNEKERAANRRVEILIVSKKV